MPIYQYKDKRTGKQIEVIRRFSDYQIPPTLVEADKVLTKEEFDSAEWERVIGEGIKTSRAPGFGSKGNWAFLLFFLAGAILGSIMVPYPAKGAEYYILEPDKLSFETSKIYTYRDLYIPDYTVAEARPTETGQEEYWLYGMGFNFNINLLRKNNLRAIYWDNRVNMVATNKQVRYVAWDYKIGTNLIEDRLNLFYHHKSEHWLEGDRDSEVEYDYPLLDEITLELVFLTR